MIIDNTWIGNLYGTNTGNIFIEITEENGLLSGILRINDPTYGLEIYSVILNISSDVITINGHLYVHNEEESDVDPQISKQKTFFAHGKINEKGVYEGKWETNIGTRGIFIVSPLKIDDKKVYNQEQIKQPEQVYLVRHEFISIDVDLSEIEAIGKYIQSYFSSKVIISISAETEQSSYLQDFLNQKFNFDRANTLKIYANEPDQGGINRIIIVEFGPITNYVTVQGRDDGWVLGKIEQIKSIIKPRERLYVTSVRKFGVNFNQIAALLIIAYIPSFTEFWKRILFIMISAILLDIVQKFHKKFFPNSIIRLKIRPTSEVIRLFPTVISWIIAVSAGIVATLTATYLQGWAN